MMMVMCVLERKEMMSVVEVLERNARHMVCIGRNGYDTCWWYWTCSGIFTRNFVLLCGSRTIGLRTKYPCVIQFSPLR